MERLPPERNENGAGSVTPDLGLEHNETPFEKFHDLAKRLLAVRRDEIVLYQNENVEPGN